ncbi:MAG TPA: 4Fe-4S dicluster domain-containing protein [Steroidobacteraceae bacterium]
MNKRDFLKDAIFFFPAVGMLQALASSAEATAAATPGAAGYDPTNHWYGMGVDVDKCIGCNRCVEACKAENGVPEEPFFFRTWIERYEIRADGEVTVKGISTLTPEQRLAAQDEPIDPSVVRTFFVPKLCNQCAHPPCVQVCPVGATFQTKDGVVLVDEDRCIGCRYCIQACPYGARYLNPRTRTADKCTFCYHRITQGLLPACVEVCPTEARIFGDLRAKADRLVSFQRDNVIGVLKPDLNTEPKVRYANLDGEVR